jgi:hypothetical protein
MPPDEVSRSSQKVDSDRKHVAQGAARCQQDFRFESAGKPQIREIRFESFVGEHVRWFDIAMDNVSLMKCVKHTSGAKEDSQKNWKGQARGVASELGLNLVTPSPISNCAWILGSESLFS